MLKKKKFNATLESLLLLLSFKKDIILFFTCCLLGHRWAPCFQVLWFFFFFLSLPWTYESHDVSSWSKLRVPESIQTYHVLRSCGDFFSTGWVICFSVVWSQKMPGESRKLNNTLMVIIKANIPDSIFSIKGMIIFMVRKSWISDALILFQYRESTPKANQTFSYTS